MPKTIKLKLVLRVEFDPQGETKEDLKHRLNQVVRDAVNNGTLTGDSPATVEEYDYTVTEIKPSKRGKPTKCPKCGKTLSVAEKQDAECYNCGYFLPRI